MESGFIKIDPIDNVAVALDETPDNTRASRSIVTRHTIPAGHKVALKKIARNDPVIKYGQVIGLASQAIAPGDHVHTHNLSMCMPETSGLKKTDSKNRIDLPADLRSTFDGILRPSALLPTTLPGSVSRDSRI